MKRTNYIWKAAGILIVGILLGYLFFGGGNDVEEAEDHDHSEMSEDQIWTCSMHPSVRQNEPGDCPICGMDLIPVSVDESQLDLDMFVMSENALKLANVETMVVGTGETSKEIRLNGKVEVDERNTYTQSTHIPGRIEQLRVNFTGEKVNRGQVLASVYSPDLVTAQEELLQAAEIKESQPELFEAAKQKLRNWKISEAQITSMLSRGETIDRFPITADVGGVVTDLMAEQGDYLERGMPIYEIANLDKLWVLFDVYESNMSWIKEGNTIKYTIQSIPGETFEGEVKFVDPLLNSNTRVATARVEVDNQNRRLKPGMFATGIIENKLDSENEGIVIPQSAVLWTGKRSVVYVKEDVQSGAGFKLREVVLGSSLGDSYVVEEGISEGEEIVVNGTFTVDAAVQLSGRPSMMNPDQQQGRPAGSRHDHGVNMQESHLEVKVGNEAKKELEKVLNSYMTLKDALVNDDYADAKQKVSELNSLLGSFNITLPSAEENIWESFREELSTAAQGISSAENIQNIRSGFDELSETMIGMVKTFQLGEGTLYVQHCPMANNDKGADWLSLSREIRNPYYGSAMLSCGEVQESIE
ncbi:efflux RND transporter periplasmic adaptor subunit [Salegentibacter sp. JZCK2]|uniref:efflux RND transporter periplasmic adaptor subunit n=1 Tax=Salegentibacter tibetensis TaxID=2873600 RepID=UPI001CCE2648|nr:efflux RND transporter periplasmic adaptor subunit [Salegentibacter tibetensis]MBZ9730739.1 efflux RND transporter periplasmic adaptor subunit [Salegentibacter tibetensis]